MADIYRQKGLKLIEINNALKELNIQAKILREKKKMLENDFADYFEHNGRESFKVGTQVIKFKKKEKKKGINAEVIENSLKGLKNKDAIMENIQNNREEYVQKSITIS